MVAVNAVESDVGSDVEEIGQLSCFCGMIGSEARWNEWVRE